MGFVTKILKKGIECVICKHAIHRKCNNLSKKENEFYKNNPEKFYCIKCVATNILFSNLTDNELFASFKGINTSLNSMQDFSPSQQKLFNKLNNLTSQNSGDTVSDNNDDEISINCKYYSIKDFSHSKFNAPKSFSILHLNIHSIQLHIEELRLVLKLLEFQFDIIAISESKLQKGLDPNVNILIKGYQNPISTPTESSKGGILIYVASNLNFKPRNDLNIYKSKELESVFIEIINPKEANSIVGVIYRHPCMDPTLFNDDFLNPLLSKLSKGNNKNIFLTGDLNFDLLKVSSNIETANFYNSLSSNLLLPLITLSTKINTVNDTLIDNIITNHFNPDFITGNLTIGISDHLPSFMIVPLPNQHHPPKNHNIYKRHSKKLR